MVYILYTQGFLRCSSISLVSSSLISISFKLLRLGIVLEYTSKVHFNTY